MTPPPLHDIPRTPPSNLEALAAILDRLDVIGDDLAHLRAEVRDLLTVEAAGRS